LDAYVQLEVSISVYIAAAAPTAGVGTCKRLVLPADGYGRRKLMDKAAFKDFVIEIIRRIDANPDFKVPPRRWVIERTFGWITRWRHLVRDYEQRIDVSKAMIHVALGSLLLRHIAH
jgi:hypothetical protein